MAQATLKDPASFIPREKFAVIHQAVLDACDALDGVKDGVLEDPRTMPFRPEDHSMRGGRLAGLPDAAAGRGRATHLRAGEESANRRRDLPGLEPGSETGWVAMAGGPRPLSISNDHFRFLVFKNPDWDFKTLDFDKDVALADRLDNGTDRMRPIRI